MFIMVGAIGPVAVAKAQEEDGADARIFFGVVIEPALDEVSLAPGGKHSDTIRLTNDFQEGETFTFYPQAVNFRQAGESGVAQLYINEELPDSADASDWISFAEESYTVSFGESVTSNYTLTIPPDAEPGGYYIALVYKKQETENVSNVAIGEAIGSLLFITVEGDLDRNGELLEFKTDKRLYDFTPVEFSIRYKNTGNVHDAVGGNIFIHQGDISNPVATLEVNPDGKIVLPGSIRQYFEYHNSGFIRWDEGRLKFEFKEFPKLHFGRYKATLKLKHFQNGERVTTEKEVTFWVIPWELILILIIIILAVAYYIRRKMKKNEKAQKRA